MNKNSHKNYLQHFAAMACMLTCFASYLLSGCGASDLLTGKTAVSGAASAPAAEGTPSPDDGGERPAGEERPAGGAGADASGIPAEHQNETAENSFYHYFTQEDGAPSDPADEEKQLSALKGLGGDVYVWAAYWDITGTVRTISRNRESIDRVGIFAAWYPDGENLALSDEAIAAARHLSSLDDADRQPRYLTIVNDTKKAQKSVSLLERLIGDAEKAERTADSIAEMAEKYDCAGVEIDFEKIRKDMPLWDKFILFEKKMMQRCGEKGLTLRILLEPSTPVEKIDLPDGPEYVVMCYNLYGYGTEPGPKADAEFLTALASKFESLGNVSYALANGGYDFGAADGTASATPSEINKLISDHNASPVRDAGSGALKFTYGSHTVWYADAGTLQYWAEILGRAAGRTVDISLWRLFGTGG